MRTSLLVSGTAALLGLALPVPAPTFPAPAPTVDEAGFSATAAAMRAAGEPWSGWVAAGRRFAAFDPTGDGTAVEIVGDLAHAAHIAVLVPGVDTTLGTFDRGLGGVARRAPSVQARVLHDRLRAEGRPTAVVAWLGYDPPEGLSLDAARADRARTGAAALTAFVRALGRQHPGVPVTLIGHSYGALVVGLAAPATPDVRDVVALGAPGMGVDTAADLGGVRVWSALAPTDWIRRIPQVRLARLGHGRRPSSPAFGARALPTGGVAGHDGYLVPGTATLDAVAAVVLGSTEVPTTSAVLEGAL